jgi:hypothetical protein
MSLRLYILKGHTPVPVEDPVAWGRAYDIKNRRVAEDTVDGVRVSTVFLGMDMRCGNGPPLLFETMVFDGYHDGETVRCSTWEQAEKQHSNILYKIVALTEIV